MDFTIRPIGIIHTPFTDKENTPIQPSRSEAAGRVEVYPEFADGLQDVDGFSHLILLYVFHRSSGCTLSARPFLDDRQRGLFATRYPARPNPIGLSIVRLIERHANELVTDGVFRISRNPMYLGFVLLLAGLVMLLGSTTPWIVVVIFPFLMERRFVRAEEAMLETRFGDSWRQYKRRVRRWL